MRIRLSLVPRERECVFPINYQYPLSSAICKIFNTASPEYAKFLHDKGCHSPQGTPLKLFTFSQIWCPRVERFRTSLVVKNYQRCSMCLSSPMLNEFVENYVLELFKNQELEIAGPQSIGRFIIQHVEAVPEPNFDYNTCFKCLSPILITKMRPHNGKMSPYYLRPGDIYLSEAIRHNLIQKFKKIYKRAPRKRSLYFKIDMNYVYRRGGYDRISKLITIKEGDARHETRVKAFISPFILSGSFELMKIAYECGIGDKNSLGFGMIQKV